MSHYFLAPPGAGGGGVTSREASDFDRQGEPCSRGGEDGKRLFDAGCAGFAVAQGEICSTEAAGERKGHGAVSAPMAGGCVPRTGMSWSWISSRGWKLSHLRNGAAASLTSSEALTSKVNCCDRRWSPTQPAVGLRQTRLCHANGGDVGAGTSEVLRSHEISLCEPVNWSHRTMKLPEKSQRLKNKVFSGDLICIWGSRGLVVSTFLLTTARSGFKESRAEVLLKSQDSRRWGFQTYQSWETTRMDQIAEFMGL